MRAKIIILIMFTGILTVGILLFTMKGRPRKTWMIPLPPTTSPAAGAKTGALIMGGAVVGTVPTQSPPSVPIDPEFQKFIADEAKEVDATHIDGKKKQHELAQVVAKLTPHQARQLLQTVKNPASSAGERILSTYLMVEAGPRAEAELRELITAPVSNSGPHESHSEDELRAMQERSVRAMAIDGLISRAETQPAAREALAKAIPDIPDPYIKSYAEKRFAEIKAH